MANEDVRQTLRILETLGRDLEKRPAIFGGESVRERLISRLLKIRSKEGKLLPLLPNRAQKEFSAAGGRRSIVLKARQMGITTWVAARFFVATISRRGILTVLVAHDQASAEYIFQIVHRFWANLPERLRKGALRTSRANVRQLVFPELDSEYRVESAADADAGRGLTIQHLHGSEVARWPGDAAATLASLRAAVTPGGEVVLESTARGAMGCFYQEWQQAKATGYTQHFYPWWWEASYQEEHPPAAGELSEEESELKRKHGLSDAQIAYRRQKAVEMRGLMRQEFAEDAETCFLLSGDCVFEVEIIDKLLLAAAEGEHPEKDLTVWCPPSDKREYIIGVDPAGGGVGGDFSCAEVIDRDGGLQCAELHGHLPPAELAEKIARLGRMYNDALLVVERNNQGGEVLARLGMRHKYENVYLESGREGCYTTADVRSQIISELGTALMERAEIFSSARLLRELRTFVRRKDGSGGAGPGAHDDCVMAIGHALRVRTREAGTPGDKKFAVGSLPERDGRVPK